MAIKRDNSSFTQKVRLRRSLREELGDVGAVLETHGGAGGLYAACYADVERGAVYEKDVSKAETLAAARPAWAVYEGDAVAGLQAGVGWPAEPGIVLVDIDPYGSPWAVIDALLRGHPADRPWPARWGIAVHDGLRHRLKIGNRPPRDIQGMGERYGVQALYHDYLAICERELAARIAGVGGRMRRWAGWYSGSLLANTHYAAVIEHINSTGSAETG